MMSSCEVDAEKITLAMYYFKFKPFEFDISSHDLPIPKENFRSAKN